MITTKRNTQPDYLIVKRKPKQIPVYNLDDLGALGLCVGVASGS